MGKRAELGAPGPKSCVVQSGWRNWPAAGRKPPQGTGAWPSQAALTTVKACGHAAVLTSPGRASGRRPPPSTGARAMVNELSHSRAKCAESAARSSKTGQGRPTTRPYANGWLTAAIPQPDRRSGGVSRQTRRRSAPPQHFQKCAGHAPVTQRLPQLHAAGTRCRIARNAGIERSCRLRTIAEYSSSSLARWRNGRN